MASILISIGGGVLAGALVLWGDNRIRKELDRRQQRKAERAIGQFFREWEHAINDAASFSTDDDAGVISEKAWRFATHARFMRRASNLVARWSRHLTPEQVENLNNYLEDHQAVIDLIGPRGGSFEQIHYNGFFREAREIDWLKF